MQCAHRFKGKKVQVQVEFCHLEIAVQPVVAGSEVGRAGWPVHPLDPLAGHHPGAKHLMDEGLGDVGGVEGRAVLGMYQETGNRETG